jgi:hypothetical protein
MSDKINFKLFKPFGSTVAKAVMPLGLMKDFQDDLKQIIILTHNLHYYNKG